MDLIVQVLLILIGLSALFQMSHWKTVIHLIISIGMGGLAYLSYPWVIEQSRDQLYQWINDTVIMQNLAVILVIEAMLFISVDFTMLKKHFGINVRKVFEYFSYYPGILIFAVILYLQMLSFYSFTSVDFDLIGLYYSLGLTLFVFVAPLVLNWLVPENSIRMELRYILNFGQILGGIVITVFCQGLTYPRQESSFEWAPLLIVSIITVLMILAGWLGPVFWKRIKFGWKY